MVATSRIHAVGMHRNLVLKVALPVPPSSLKHKVCYSAKIGLLDYCTRQFAKKLGPCRHEWFDQITTLASIVFPPPECCT